ncbi:MBL fold metallo-hydrolase [Bremerella sp. P1]|uniref:MBL fold metallo-hydrolase n=1 Tax=Bremerella sp. P1 TaxID=3026424 RepID=UPI002368588A|nr:MBL fold metallo-hydrolase [Bremerella sp. P1]WDI41423.1 MBL fold metallo-hydrolase [Bremerella sp. P1]
MKKLLGLLLSFWLTASCLAVPLPQGLSQPLPEMFPDLYQSSDTCNVYILKHGGSALLINVGNGQVFDLLPQIGVGRVEKILLNNHHRETLQGFARVDTDVTKVATSEIEAEILQSPTSFRKWYPKLGDQYSVYGASYARPPQRPIPMAQPLEDNAEFIWHGYHIRCLVTPGHSPGEMTYLVTKGDHTVAVTGGLMHDSSRFTTWFDSEWDYGFAKGIDALATSVDRLLEEEIHVMLPIQGPVIHHATTQLKTYRERIETFRAAYIRGYPVFDKDPDKRDRISKPTEIPHLNQVTPHLYKLNDEFQGRNFYMIVSDSGHGLILDCGLFPKAVLEEVILGLRQHKGLKQVDAFWISHMHGDHFLHGPLLKEKYGAKAWTLDKIVDRCENPRKYDYAALVSAYGDGFDGMPIDKGFTDGEVIDWEGYKIQVDWLPGQTEFGCCLWLDIDGKRIAFTGDNLFGDPRDESQTAHDCVVARNSAILEEGHILGSKYLIDLKPDIVLAAHGYVMPEPQGILQRYHNWAKEMAALYHEMLPEKDYEYLFDPYWVSAYPYRVNLGEGSPQKVTITVRNFRDQPQQHRVKLILPDGIAAEPAILKGTVPAKSRQSYEVTISGTLSDDKADLQIVPLDIELDGKHYGQWFDFLVGREPTE